MESVVPTHLLHLLLLLLHFFGLFFFPLQLAAPKSRGLAGARQLSLAGDTTSHFPPSIHLDAAHTLDPSLYIFPYWIHLGLPLCLSARAQRISLSFPLFNAFCLSNTHDTSASTLPFLFHNCIFLPSSVLVSLLLYSISFFPSINKTLSAYLCSFCCTARCDTKAFVGLPPLWCGETEMHKDKVELRGASFQKVTVHSEITAQPESWTSWWGASQTHMLTLVCVVDCVLICVAEWILCINRPMSVQCLVSFRENACMCSSVGVIAGCRAVATVMRV